MMVVIKRAALIGALALSMLLVAELRAEGGVVATSTAAAEHGPHGGWLLRDGDLSLELSIFERGVPPQLRLYGYLKQQPLDPTQLRAEVVLTRLGGQQERFECEAVGPFLAGKGVVAEPHSFDLEVSLTYLGRQYHWKFSSYEGRVTIPAAVAVQTGIESERAGARTIQLTQRARGTIEPSEHKIAHIIPRFAGMVREGRKHIGDRVEKGEVLAIIESNQSLQPFEVRSQIAGTVVQGHLIVGEYVAENQAVYVVADLSEVWADLAVPLRQRDQFKIGQSVSITPLHGGAVAGRVLYVAPYVDAHAQSQLVRVVLANSLGALLPGMHVIGEVVVDEVPAAVAVRRNAVQRMGSAEVVFVRVGDIYEARPVTLGAADSEWYQIVAGLAAGEEYVVRNSFVVKADILKSGAAHEH
jgi:cobalt-zinc-cadmium efflux system membrane fusion protein